MSSFLKDPQCLAVRTDKHCSKTTAILPLTQRVAGCRVTTSLSSDEPCWQSCAARARLRLFYREEHRNAPVKLAAAQAGPWHRPANYRPPQLDSATDIEYLEGHTREPKENKRIAPRKEKVKLARKAEEVDGLYRHRQYDCPESP